MREEGRCYNWSKENAKNRHIYRSRTLKDCANGGKTDFPLEGVVEKSIESLPNKTEFACLSTGETTHSYKIAQKQKKMRVR